MIKRTFKQSSCTFFVPWDLIACIKNGMCNGKAEDYRNGFYWGLYEQRNY